MDIMALPLDRWSMDHLGFLFRLGIRELLMVLFSWSAVPRGVHYVACIAGYCLNSRTPVAAWHDWTLRQLVLQVVQFPDPRIRSRLGTKSLKPMHDWEMMNTRLRIYN
jgi:hypothetical protein